MADIIDEEEPVTPEEDPEIELDESILSSIMKRVGVDPEDNSVASYKEDLMQAINTALVSLTQAGIGPNTGFRVTSIDATWTDFFGDAVENVDNAKDYVYMRCRLVFDPPTAAVVDSYIKMMEECLWRCNITAEGLTI